MPQARRQASRRAGGDSGAVNPGALALVALALGAAGAVSSWAVLAVVLTALPWLLVVLLPRSRRLRRERPRTFAWLTTAGALLIAAAVGTAFAVEPAPPAALTALAGLVAYALLVVVPLMDGRPR